MPNPSVTRRSFVRNTLLTAAALPLAGCVLNSAKAGKPAIPGRKAVKLTPGAVPLHWLDGAPTASNGVTWGVPWPRGERAKDAQFALATSTGESVPVQSWPLAYWPDGSLKWTAHAIGADAGRAEDLTLTAGAPAGTSAAATLGVTETSESFEIDTGVIRCRVARSGSTPITAIMRDGREIARDGRLVCLRQDSPELTAGHAVQAEAFTGEISRVTLEQNGPVRAVVKIEGKHAGSAGRAWLPFVLRLYFYAGGEAVRLMHTIVFDGDENKDFIRGLGLRFSVPMRGELHDRHVRFSGEGSGLFAEAVRGLTGLRRDPGREVTEAQLAGRATPPVETFPQTVRPRLNLIPAFGDYTLFQPTADSFEIRKRTKAGFTWLNSAYGHRASGLAYIGTPQGGVALGLRNFWQSHPAQIDIRNATTDLAEITLWVWAPDAAPMDLRFYHDGMGQDTHAKQLEGLEITYEDYEPGFGTAMGVARTSEATLWALPATPTRERLVQLANLVTTPPMIACAPEYLHAAGAFGRIWSLPDRSTPMRAGVEDRLDWQFAFYQKQVDQQRWYGFWNYGDVMHSYDAARHVWKYDVGGFAWDNSELSTDIWLWLHFLRTGRGDAFRFAEAMTRHTGEVDVHHLGRFAPLGSRHNVLHWGCSAKQLRISTVQNRRYYYYLTADERVGDLVREQVEADRTLLTIQPGRKVAGRRPRGNDRPRPEQVAAPADPNRVMANVGFGTDWGSLAAAWLMEWERTGDTRIRDKLLNSMRTIGAQPRGFFSSSGRMDLATGEFQVSTSDRAGASHLSAAFGLPEVCAELIETVDVPEFKRAWLQYCELYNAPAPEQEAALGRALGELNLAQGHARLTAYAAHQKNDARLAARAWQEFLTGGGGFPRDASLNTRRIEGPAVLNPVDEAPWISTNGSAQWGLSAIQCLALAGAGEPAQK
jgi:hypothetical protein